jgi:tRNA U34 5-methylaminomethyl-2-thiouridine-forming methyltransferase MnmC
MHTAGDLILQPTADGSFTFYSATFGETFHSHSGGKQEAEAKFILPTQLAKKARAQDLKILDICYGLGYNTAAALEAIWGVNAHCRVELIALEIDPKIPQAAIAQGCLQPWSEPIQEITQTLATTGQIATEFLQAQLMFGDARQTIQQLCQQGFKADAIFLDPFSPPRCPQLWSLEFLSQVSRCLAPTGLLATYSCAAAVRTALLAAGMQIGSTRPIGRRSPGTVAGFLLDHFIALSLQEQEHLQTRAAIPYRDPKLAATATEILDSRHREQQQSPLEPTTRWKQRWGLD